MKKLYSLIVLVIISLSLGIVSLPDDKLHLITCDVGQGDANLILYKNTQILIDGGKGDMVLECLQRHVPFWDKTIETVIISHPQDDHFGGIIDVAKSYQVKNYLVSGLNASSQKWSVLEGIVGSTDSKIVYTKTGDQYQLGLIHLDILWPKISDFKGLTMEEKTNDQKVLGTFTSSQDPNDFSVVLNLKYKNFTAIYTGDIGPDTEENIIKLNVLSNVDLLKVPHHGSKNGLSENFLKKLSPKIAVIGVGKNPWGHPHQEILNLLQDYKVQTYRTDKDGDIQVITNGNGYKVLK